MPIINTISTIKGNNDFSNTPFGISLSHRTDLIALENHLSSVVMNIR